MAIFAGVPGIEVTIHQNGVATREYDNDEVDMNDGSALSQYQASKTVSKYIEAHTGQDFSIEISAESCFKLTTPGMSFEIFVDGYRAATPLLRKDSLKTTTDWNRSTAGFRFRDDRGNWKIQNFKFEEIKTTTEEPQDMMDASARIDKIGEIAIWVYRKSNFKPLGDAKPTTGHSYYTSEKKDGEGRPIAIYKFKYRSLAALQSLLVVPHERSPDVTPRSSPTPATAHRHDFFENPNPGLVDLKTATPEEQRMLALILGTLRAHGSPFPEAKMDNRGIKREGVHAGGSRRKAKQESASFVDLSQDQPRLAVFDQS